jgi:hypothetical protein
MPHDILLKAKLAAIREQRWSQADARVVLELLERSGDSIPVFARANDLSAQRLYWWRSRLVEEPKRNDVELEQLSFAPVVVTGLGQQSPAMRLRLGELELEVIEPSRIEPTWLARLLVSFEEGR